MISNADASLLLANAKPFRSSQQLHAQKDSELLHLPSEMAQKSLAIFEERPASTK